MLDYRSTVAAAGFVGALLVGCTDASEPSDLRTDGPPNVTTVTVMSDLETAVDPSDVVGSDLGRIVETATFCRPNDNKRPGLVGLPDFRVIQVCPDDPTKPVDNAGAAEAAPPTWFVRIVFDELLDTSIEDLVVQPNGSMIGTLKNTQPVTLKCSDVDVPYDGYYVPNGNRQSWPIGPSLFIRPTSSTSVATGASCKLSIKDNVHNKAGQSVPTEQRDYQFKLAPMKFRVSDPTPEKASDDMFVQDADTPVDFFWTAAIQGTPMGTGDNAIVVSTLDTNQVTIISGANIAGKANPDVCNGTGAAVPSAQIRALVRGDIADADPDDAPVIATTTALVLRIDVGGGTPAPATRWAPDTTYSITFTPDAKVTPSQGGADGTFPSDFKLCFHTSA